MARYAAMPRRPERSCGWVQYGFYLDHDSPLVPSCEADSHEPADTGLITATGEPIYRLPNPIGFGRNDEW